MFDNALVGVEIGKHTVKFVSGNYKMGKFVLNSHHLLETPQDAFLPDDSLNTGVMAPFLKRCVKTFNLKRGHFHVTINTSKAILRERILPRAGIVELQEISRYEIEQFLPYAVSDFVVDYRILEIGSEEGENTLRALVAAVPKEIVESYMETARKSGCRIRSVNIYSESLTRCMRRCNPHPEENILFVDIGSHLTRLTIFKQNAYFASFNSELGGDAATQQLAEDHKLDFDVAEERKLSKGLALPRDIFDSSSLSEFDLDHSLSMNDYCDELGAEISRVINFFRTRKFSGIIDRVVLSGGGSRINGMPTYLQGTLGVDVELFESGCDAAFHGKGLLGKSEDAGLILPALGAIIRG